MQISNKSFFPLHNTDGLISTMQKTPDTINLSTLWSNRYFVPPPSISKDKENQDNQTGIKINIHIAYIIISIRTHRKMVKDAVKAVIFLETISP
jgi:hypothetical protein